jgi:hypothetical protein
MDLLDMGVRCEAHVGEVFPPRCGDCVNEQKLARLGGSNEGEEA